MRIGFIDRLRSDINRLCGYVTDGHRSVVTYQDKRKSRDYEIK